jgi:hypothetical protein
MKKNIFIAVLIAGSVISAPAIAQPSVSASKATTENIAKNLEKEVEEYLTGSIVVTNPGGNEYRDLSIDPVTAQARLMRTKYYLPDYNTQEELAKAAVESFFAELKKIGASDLFTHGYRYNIKVVDLGNDRYQIFLGLKGNDFDELTEKEYPDPARN